MSWERYQAACRYLNEGLIRTASTGSGELSRREWMESFLPDLGHPERSFEAIHVAGTSGKGSVALMIAEILRHAEIDVALHVSPYLQVATEKLWHNGLYASSDEFGDLVDWIRPLAEARRGDAVPMHGMASVALALEYFRCSGATLGVMEAGVGGRSDLTNVMQTRLAVVSAIGLDHVKTLGPDLQSIAWHKAGIIKPGCRAVVLEGAGEAAARKQAQEVGAPLRVLSASDYHFESSEDGRIWLDYTGKELELKGVELGMRGTFQAQNAALALAAVEQLQQSGPSISEQSIRAGLFAARQPARLERLPPSERNTCPVILDGAHNPDKLSAMLSSLARQRSGGQLHLVYGALGSRTPDRELRQLAGAASSVTIAEPRVYQKTPRATDEIADVMNPCCATVQTIPNVEEAVEAALRRAKKEDLLLVTGSLYLCGEARERWYPAREVLRRRRSFW